MRRHVIGAAVLAGVVGLLLAADPPSSDKTPEDKPAEVGWEVRTADGKYHRVTPGEKELTVETRYGTVKVPMGEVRRVEFGLRATDAQKKKLADAMAGVTGGTGRDREAAKDALVELGLLAYPEVTRALKAAPKEALPHLALVHDKLKRLIGPDDDPPADADVVLTADGSKLSGRLVPEAVRVKVGTTEKGVSWADTRVLAFGDQSVEEKVEVVKLGAGGVHGLTQTHFEKVVAVEVTGGAGGAVWGSNPYTTDSSLEAAAVHAGVLKAGETGVIKIRVKADAGGYAGGTQNGVTTGNWGPFQGCFEVIAKKKGRGK